MDEKDREISALLVRDGRTTLKEIAHKVELPITTVHNRIKKMEGRLFHITADINHRELGFSIDSYILVSVDTSAKGVDQEELARRISGLPGVLRVSVVTGSRDMIIQATSRTIDGMSELVLKRIREFKGVASTETLVVMKDVRGRPEKLLQGVQ